MTDSPSSIGMELDKKRRKQQRPHRVVPKSQDMSYEGPTLWRCLHCHAERKWADEFDDFACCAIPLPGLETA